MGHQVTLKCFWTTSGEPNIHFPTPSHGKQVQYYIITAARSSRYKPNLSFFSFYFLPRKIWFLWTPRACFCQHPANRLRYLAHKSLFVLQNAFVETWKRRPPCVDWLILLFSRGLLDLPQVQSSKPYPASSEKWDKSNQMLGASGCMVALLSSHAPLQLRFRFSRVRFEEWKEKHASALSLPTK